MTDFTAFTELFFTAIKNTSLLEWIAVLCGILYIILAAYRRIACWFFGLISSVIYIYLCAVQNLFLETGLQAFYVVMSVYGWLTWHKQPNAQILIKMRSAGFHIQTLAIGSVVTFVLGYFFDNYTTQENPYLDASISTFSLVATFMTANRVLENWIYWIVVDFAAIFLYAYRGYALSAALYLVFTLMAIYALIQWTKQYNRQQTTGTPSAGTI